MSRRRVALTLAVVALPALLGAADRVLLEGVMVRVNERIVTVSEFSDRARSEVAQLSPPPSGDEVREYVEGLLQEVVNELVLMERATEKQIVIDDQMVNQALENLRKENKLEDDAAWQQALAGAGLTVEALRERYRRTMLLQRAVQGEIRPVEVTEEELRRQYEAEKERYRVPPMLQLEQVFLPLENETEATLRQRAQGLVDRVRDGADLKAEAILAGSELQDLGAIPVDDCRADLRAALEPLAEGGVTDPLAVPSGVQIVRLVRRIPAGYRPFEDVGPELRRQRSADSYESQTRGLVEKLKKDYLVEVHEERLPLVLARLSGGSP